jgi:chromosome segregation ATPase
MDYSAEVIELQARVADLQHSLERVREERDAARSTAALLEAELADRESLLVGYESLTHDLQKQIDRLRLHIQQGVEL